MPTLIGERRRKPRVTIWSKITLEAPEGALDASLRNLSLAGLSCTTSTPFAEMTRLQVTLDLPEPRNMGPASRVQLSGAVVRCVPMRRGNARRRYEVGVFFDQMDEAVQGKLTAFLRSRQSSPIS